MNTSEFISWLESSFTGRDIRIEKGTMCAFDTGYDSNMWLIKHGAIFSMAVGSNGDMFGNALYSNNDFLFSGHESRTIMCYSLTDCHLVKYSGKQINKEIKHQVDPCYYILMDNAQKYTKTMQITHERLLWTLEDQLAALEERLHAVEQSNGFEIDISDASIAKILGCHPVSVSRARKRLFTSRSN